ncbi:hypothetical protein BJ138DRAFT_1017617, partial [Hygrophoropsis aurantiaca]
HLEDLQNAQAFIDALKDASLDSNDVDADVLYQLRNPFTSLLDLSDPHLRLSIDLFLAVSNASQATYTSARDAIVRCYPENADKILSFSQIQQKIAQLSSVVPIIRHCCPNICVAYTGPFNDMI